MTLTKKEAKERAMLYWRGVGTKTLPIPFIVNLIIEILFRLLFILLERGVISSKDYIWIYTGEK